MNSFTFALVLMYGSVVGLMFMAFLLVIEPIEWMAVSATRAWITYRSRRAYARTWTDAARVEHAQSPDHPETIACDTCPYERGPRERGESGETCGSWSRCYR